MVMQNSKKSFLYALIFTIVVFLIGFYLGYLMEINRADKIKEILLNSELNLLDEQLRNRIVSQENLSCSLAKESVFNFADKIYKEAMLMEEYDAKSQFTNEIRLLHRRYDVLRMMLWLESSEIRKKCGENTYHSVIYLYNYAEERRDNRAKQAAFSRILEDLKRNNPSEILLIPLSANQNLDSIVLMTKVLSVKEIPSIIIDDRIVINELLSARDLEKIIFQNSTS